MRGRPHTQLGPPFKVTKKQYIKIPFFAHEPTLFRSISGSKGSREEQSPDLDDFKFICPLRNGLFAP